jgi:hypothetical protein
MPEPQFITPFGGSMQASPQPLQFSFVHSSVQIPSQHMPWGCVSQESPEQHSTLGTQTPSQQAPSNSARHSMSLQRQSPPSQA